MSDAASSTSSSLSAAAEEEARSAGGANTSILAHLPGLVSAQPLEVALSASVVILILLVGTLANTASLAVTCRHGAQSKLHWIFVGNLALSDLALALLTPGTWYMYVWASTNPGCTAAMWTEAAVSAAQSVSVSAVVAVTIDRASLVFRPIKYRLSRQRATPLLLSAAIWLGCAAAQAPKLIFPAHSRLLHRAYSVAEFAAALAALAGCNFTICRRIERSRKLKFLRRHSGFSAAAATTTGTAATALDGKGSASALLPKEVTARRGTLASIQQPQPHQLQHQQRRDTRLSLQSIQRLSLDGGHNSRRYARQRDSEEVINEILTKQHRRALRTLLLLVLLFLACRLPRTVLMMIDWTGVLARETYLRCNFYVELLVHLNSLLDPFAYVFCGNRLCYERTRDCWRLFRERCSALAARVAKRCRCCCGCCGCCSCCSCCGVGGSCGPAQSTEDNSWQLEV